MKKNLRCRRCSFSVCAAAFCLLALCACADLEYADWLTVNQREVTDRAMSKLCEGIKNPDAGAVKSLFAKTDMLEVSDFDENVQKLLNYIKGKDISFKCISGGYEDASMGTYPKERYFGGCNYEINTSEASYKVKFNYRSYYSAGQKNYFNDLVDGSKIGFVQFDIIDKEKDRKTGDKFYSGCPETKPGINFDYKTLYIYDDSGQFPKIDSFRCEKIYCGELEEFAPLIINSVAELADFYEKNKSALAARSDERGFYDVTKKYGADFFENQSVCLLGIKNGNGLMYVPQWLYMGDFVLTDIAAFQDNSTHESPDFAEKNIIIAVELPEKAADGIKARVNIRLP